MNILNEGMEHLSIEEQLDLEQLTIEDLEEALLAETIDDILADFPNSHPRSKYTQPFLGWAQPNAFGLYLYAATNMLFMREMNINPMPDYITEQDEAMFYLNEAFRMFQRAKRPLGWEWTAHALDSVVFELRQQPKDAL